MTAQHSHSNSCDYCGLPTSASRSENRPTYCGFGCRFAGEVTSASDDVTRIMEPARALGLSVFCTLLVVMFSIVLWNYPTSSNDQFESTNRELLRYATMLLTLPIMISLGRPLLNHLQAGLRSRTFTSDMLLTVGLFAISLISIINTLRGTGQIYFEVTSTVLVLFTLGRWLEADGRLQASAPLDRLEWWVPVIARFHTTHGDIDISRSRVEIGDSIHVKAGERIPLDVRITRGRGVVDEFFFTGEAAPAEKCVGDRLMQGSLNLDGEFIGEVISPPDSGAIHRLTTVVRAAGMSSGRYQRLVDSLLRWTFPIVGSIALATFIYHGVYFGWENGLLTALSVVLIGCPSALVLAVPTAIAAATGLAASRGIVCRGGLVLEKLAKIKALRWSKTGTLTTGSPRVHKFFCEHPKQTSELLQLAAQIARSSKHLYSQAIVDYVNDNDDSLAFATTGGMQIEAPHFVNELSMSARFGDTSVSRVRSLAGRGLQLTSRLGEKVCLGSIRWMDENGYSLNSRLASVLYGAGAFDKSVVAIGYGGIVRGLFVLEEQVREGAAEVVNQLRVRGLDQAVFTGDCVARAESLSRRLGLHVNGELLPEQKVEAICQARRKFNCVAMVGDQLNDAASLAAADISITLGSGADVSRASADVCILSSDLKQIPWIHDMANRTIRTIHDSLIWAIGFNTIGVILAASGNIRPVFAAAIMVMSSMIVLGNSLRLSLENGGAAEPVEDEWATEFVRRTI